MLEKKMYGVLKKNTNKKTSVLLMQTSIYAHKSMCREI